MRKARFVTGITVILSLMLILSGMAMAADFGGKTVNFVNFGEARFEAGGEAEGLVEEAEEKYNVNIEFLQFAWSDWSETFMTRLLAGDSTYDVWYIQQRQFWELMPQGAFYPVSEVLSEDYYENLPPFSSAANRTLTMNGKIYGFGNKYGDVHPLSVVAYNKTLFERDGLPDLQELYEKGEWTWAKMREIAIQGTKDTDGDGEMDQFGIANPDPIKFALANDAMVSQYNEEGKRVFSFDDPKAIAAMEFVYNLQHVDNVVGGDWQAKAFGNGHVAMQPLGMYLMGNKLYNEMEDEYAVVPYPLGPDAEDYRYPAEALVNIVLPASVEMPAELVELYHTLWPTEEYYEFTENYLQGLVRDRKSFEVLQTAIENYSGECFDLEMVIGWWPSPVRDAIGQIMSGEKSPKAAMAEIKPSVQATIDELFNQ